MILFVTRKYPPMIGGMEQLSYHLTTEVLRRRPGQVVSWGGSQRWLPAVLPALTARAAAALSRRSPPVDIIHLGDPLLSPIGLVLSRAFGVPAVCTAHGLDVTWPFPPYQRIVPPALARLDHVVAISEATRQECLRRGVPAARTSVLPVGVNLPGPGPARGAAKASLATRFPQLDPGRAWVVTIGRLVRRKGARWFAEQAFSRLIGRCPSACYVVAGGGPDEAALRALAGRGLPADLVVLGQISDADRDLLYRATDVFVMPNLPVAGDVEGFGLVAAETAAYGRAIVAAGIEGIRDVVVPDETGIVVPPSDAAAFVDAIVRLLAEPTLAERIGRAAHEHAARALDWGAIAERYIEVFDRCVRAHQKQQRKQP